MSRKVYAECNIVISPTVEAQPLRKRMAEVNMDIVTSQGVGPQTKPITLVIKGGNISHIFKLMTIYHKTDEELAEKARGSAVADLVEGMTVEETAAWWRGNILDELKEMQGGAGEDPLVSG